MTEFKVMNKAGHVDFVSEKDVGLAEKDGYTVVVSNGKSEDTVAFKDLQLAKKDGFIPVKDVGYTESAVRGGAQGLSFGLSDELVGGVEAILNKIKTLGASYLTDDYKRNRDAERELNKQAEMANPKTYLGGEIAGGVAGAFIPGVGAVGNAGKLLKVGEGVSALSKIATTGARLGVGGAVQGALTGLGKAEGDVSHQLAETAKGGVIGGVGGAVLGAAGSALMQGGKFVAPYVKPVIAGAFKEASGPLSSVEQLIGFPTAGTGIAGIRALKAVQGAFKGISEHNQAKIASQIDNLLVGVNAGDSEAASALQNLLSKETKLAEMLSDVVPSSEKLSQVIAGGKKVIKPFPSQDVAAIGSGKTLQNISQDNPLTTVGMNEGDSALNKWVAHNSSISSGSNIDPADYQQALNMGSERRNVARAFKPNDVGTELNPTLSEFQETFLKDRNAAFGRLQEKAAQESTVSDLTPIKTFTQSLTRESEHSVIPAKQQKEFAKAMAVLEDGSDKVSGSELDGIGGGGWDLVTQAERYKRLQYAREILDEQSSYFSANGMKKADIATAKLRSELDGLLKASPSKVTADELFSRGKDLENRVFEGISFGKGQGRGIDDRKLAGILGDTASAARFKDAMTDMRKYYDDLGVHLEDTEIAKKALDAIEGYQNVAADKQVLSRISGADGPSGMAIKQLMGKQGLLKNAALESPGAYMNQLDRAVQAYGKDNAGAVPGFINSALIKMKLFVKKNPQAAPEVLRRAGVAAGLPENMLP